ncbi:MAG: EamA family transporter [Myxococcota bacterium]
MTPALRGRLDIAAAALLFSTGGAAIKFTVLAGWQVAGLRSLVAAVALWLLLPQARGRWDRKVLLVAVAYAGTLTSFTLATKLTTAGNAIFLQSTAPLYVLIFSPILLGERIRRWDLPIAGLIAMGLYCILAGGTQSQATAPDPLKGNLLGVVAGLTWAGTLMGLRSLGSTETEGTDPSTTAVVAGNVLTFVFSLPFLGGFPEEASLADGLTIVYLGVFQVAAAYVFLTRGLRRVPAFAASLIILIEPALNPAWAFAFQGEQRGLWSIVGGALSRLASFTKTGVEVGSTRS